MFVLYRVPQDFGHVLDALRIAEGTAFTAVPVAIFAALLAPRRVLPNLAIAAAVLSIALWWTTGVIENDARDAAGANFRGDFD